MLRLTKVAFYLLVGLFDLDAERKVHVKESDDTWHWEPKYDEMHEMYVTNSKGKVPTPSGSWGFWVYSPTLKGLYKESLVKLWNRTVGDIPRSLKRKLGR